MSLTTKLDKPASNAICPNCAAPCIADTDECARCGAVFDNNATWHPLLAGQKPPVQPNGPWWLFGVLAVSLYLLWVVTQAVGQSGKATSARAHEQVRYSAVPVRVALRPSNISIIIPSNELWYVHTNTISRGYPENEPVAGKPWDRAEVRLLLPKFESVTPANEKTFAERGGSRLLIITIMRPQGFDGDPRRQWSSSSLIPTDEDQARLIEHLKTDERVRPPKLVQRHEELRLDEYEGKDEWSSRYFLHDDFLLRCWAPPFSTIKQLCESAFNLPNGLLVNFQFPLGYLADWHEIRDHAVRTASGYQYESESSVWERLRRYF